MTRDWYMGTLLYPGVVRGLLLDERNVMRIPGVLRSAEATEKMLDGWVAKEKKQTKTYAAWRAVLKDNDVEPSL